jgi:hypothetical protein
MIVGELFCQLGKKGTCYDRSTRRALLPLYTRYSLVATCEGIHEAECKDMLVLEHT